MVLFKPQKVARKKSYGIWLLSSFLPARGNSALARVATRVASKLVAGGERAAEHLLLVLLQLGKTICVGCGDVVTRSHNRRL